MADMGTIAPSTTLAQEGCDVRGMKACAPLGATWVLVHHPMGAAVMFPNLHIQTQPILGALCWTHTYTIEEGLKLYCAVVFCGRSRSGGQATRTLQSQ